MNANTPPILELRDMRKEYRLRQGMVTRLRHGVRSIAAVDGVSLTLPTGSIVGLVGESGSGKSTLAQLIVRLVAPSSGTMLFRGEDVSAFDRSSNRRFRRSVQMVFQDTTSSLNPRKRVRRVIAEALAARGVTRGAAANEAAQLMERVGLDTPLMSRFPHELSGGQRQRVGIARALAMAPDLLIADEPVSALDVSLQGQIINLLEEIRVSLGLSIILISHDLAVVARICSTIAVMSKGRLVETGPSHRVLYAPEHPYTRTLLDAMPGAHTRGPPISAGGSQLLRAADGASCETAESYAP